MLGKSPSHLHNLQVLPRAVARAFTHAILPAARLDKLRGRFRMETSVDLGRFYIFC